MVRTKDGCELRFLLRSSEAGVGGAIEDYKRKLGSTKAQLRIAYDKQGDLPLDEGEETEG